MILSLDLGTSSVKAVIIDMQGRIQTVAAHEYPIYTPQPGHSEQDPRLWWSAAVKAARAALSHVAHPEIFAIGLCGQMHGFALIGAAGEIIAPAIIWPDQRSVQETHDIVEMIGAEHLAQITGTLPATGFMNATLLWLLRHQPDLLEQTRWCILPKDYVRFCLTGEIATDTTDASATGLFDIRERRWSEAIIQKLGLPGSLLPPVLEPAAIAGQLMSEAAEALGLKTGIPVVAGCADQVAQAVSNGLVEPGDGSVTLGTGGQIFVPLATPQVDLHLHTFCHAPSDRWYFLGAMLAGGLSLRWLRDLLGLTAEKNAYQSLAEAAAQTPPGADGLLFLPYLVGERAPIMDPLASGTFVGLSLRHHRGHLARAIMEGVAFGLRHILDTMMQQQVEVTQLVAAGNGLGSPIWRNMVVDILQRPLTLSESQEQTGVGAALIAGIGTGSYGSYSELSALTPKPTIATDPRPELADFYTQQYQLYLQTYQSLQSVMHHLHQMELAPQSERQ